MLAGDHPPPRHRGTIGTLKGPDGAGVAVRDREVRATGRLLVRRIGFSAGVSAVVSITTGPDTPLPSYLNQLTEHFRRTRPRDMADTTAATRLYGIDPGSSKPWAVYSATRLSGTTGVTPCNWDAPPIRDLGKLVDEIASHSASGSPVVLSIDAPLSRVDEFHPSGFGAGGRAYPFNVSPFSTRPCEKALVTRPQVVKRSLACRQLVDMIAALCGWEGEYKDKANLPFTKRHDGISVLGYMRAPHGPVVSLFVRLLQQCSEVSFSPSEAQTPVPGKVYVLESHPAVSLGVWAEDRRLGTVRKVPKYKTEAEEDESADQSSGAGEGSMVVSGVRLLREPVVGLARAEHGLEAPLPENDDQLDGLVGLLNVVDLAAGRGDWFGTEQTGYFLIPRFGRYPEGSPATMGEAWEKAFTVLAAVRPPATPRRPRPTG